MTDDGWWRRSLGGLVEGRKVILAGGVAAGWTPEVPRLRALGAADILVVATDGRGAGPQPDCACVALELPQGIRDVMARMRAGLAALTDPPAEIVDAVEAFDIDRTAVVFGVFLVEAPTLCGRPFVAHRRPEWVALEDKTRVDDVLDRAGVPRSSSTVVPIAEARARWRALDAGGGTVWAADATKGYHGGGSLTRWVADEADAERVTAELAAHCQHVRVMPLLDGVATSVHGIVLPDGIAVLRPVELVTLRQGRQFRYSGCATFWDPPPACREEMRDAARRVGTTLRDDVGFRGAFTLDGVMTHEGFRPTELNPRFGAGLSVITSGLGDLPLLLLLDLVVAGHSIGIRAADLEATVLAEADAHRSGGTWQLSVDVPTHVESRQASYADGVWRWSADGEVGDATVVAGGTFARAIFDPDRTPVGPSVGERAVAFWRFMDAEVGTNVGPLTAPPDITSVETAGGASDVRSSDRPPPSTRP